jgi:hypothetical protein
VSGSWLPWVHGDAFLPVPTSIYVYQRSKRWSCEDVKATSWVEEHIGGVVVRLTWCRFVVRVGSGCEPRL